MTKWKRIRPGLYRYLSPRKACEIERGRETRWWWWKSVTSGWPDNDRHGRSYSLASAKKAALGRGA